VTNWPAVWAIFAGGLVAGAYMTKVAPAIPGLRDELGLTLVESGLIATMFNLMGMLVGMLAGEDGPNCRPICHAAVTGIFSSTIFFDHSAGPVVCTEVPLASTATVTGMSFTSNS